MELPNTRGMSQFADGGIDGSKPYVFAAAHINRMSNYCGTCSYYPKKRYGENACPFNSLFWAFYIHRRQALQKNPRTGFVYKNLAKLDQTKKYVQHIDAL